uniref:Uncharacterized protein n=1 Tax=viral metagenome TaxID=1070528 RepID=A0A6M3K1R2_9ZZZZ
MSERDPYLLDPEDAKKTIEETKMSSVGVICPFRNASMGKKCHVCEKLKRVYETSVKGDERWQAAGKKGAKCSWFANVVFPSNPNKSVVAVFGKKTGSDVVYKNQAGEWLDIAHPKSGRGREMKLTKSRDDSGYNTYSIFPDLEKASWDIPEEVLKNLVNLDQENLIVLVKNNTEEIFKFSSLKMDETIRFRFCPPWDSGNGNKKILTPLFRHWGGVTEEEVRGEVELDLDVSDVEPEVAVDEGSILDDTPTVDSHVEAREPCFGRDNFYDKNDQECKGCKEFTDCTIAVKASL